MDTGVSENPFSSHLLEPSRGGYIFPPGDSLLRVVAELERRGWRGELTGNHGAGKSTLLADLCAHLEQSGRTAIWWQSSDRRRFPPKGWLRDIKRADVIAYDGAERLLPGLLLLIRIVTRLRGRGLVVTTHWRHGFGAVIPVKPNALTLAEKVAEAASTEFSPDEWHAKIDQALARHNGNSRQVLFDLYMEYETSRRRGSNRGKVTTPDAD